MAKVGPMARLIFSLGILLSFVSCDFVYASLQSQYQVVSDFDDTIKITNVLDKSDSIRNTLFRDDIFTGTSLLYQSFVNGGNPLTIISGGLRSLRRLAIHDLTLNDVPFTQLFMRNPLREDPFTFKYNHIHQVAEQFSSSLILIGDDGEQDPKIYGAYQADHPDKVLAIYIRHVANRRLPTKEIGFYTAFEVAFWEYLAGRLKVEDVQNVALSLLRQTEVAKVFPKFVTCPTTESGYSEIWLAAQGRAEIKPITRQVIDVLVESCRNR